MGTEDLVRRHSPSLLRLARKHSLCDDDADDAVQQAVEIYLRRVDRLEAATAAGWLRTVCKHEALRIRRAQCRVLPTEPVEWDEMPSNEAPAPLERALAREHVARVARALSAGHPDAARALVLRAAGFSYRDIAEHCGWSYARVNRLLAHGRASLRAELEEASAV